MSNPPMRRTIVGEVRPSQALTTYGIGSLVDLPRISALVMGLEDWQQNLSDEINEPRLLASAKKMLGDQLNSFRSPPRGPEEHGRGGSPWDESRLVGIPVAPFPRWMVCPRCHLLAPLSSELFIAKADPFRPEATQYQHDCGRTGSKPVAVVPARLLLTCERGHLDDFPWVYFVHGGKTDCAYRLSMLEFGVGGEMADVTIKCNECGKKRRLSDAFGPLARDQFPGCTARHPHLRDSDAAGCNSNTLRAVALGASNLWFPMLISALSIPRADDALGILIDEHWSNLSVVTSLEILKAFRQTPLIREFVQYDDAELWEKIQTRRDGEEAENDQPHDLKGPEWQVFTEPHTVEPGDHFQLRRVDLPEDFRDELDKVVLVEKLREVRALTGFTRLVSPREFDHPVEMPAERRVSLSRQHPTWIPASETRGEGIFIQFREERIAEWEARNRDYERIIQQGHVQYREARGVPDPEEGYPGIRFVLLHSFAHALMRQLAVECGYMAASISERIYARGGTEAEPMAGVLIYTSASDSEGTLGGLSSLGEPDKLNRHLKRALEKVSLCSSDPLCSEHEPGSDDTLHGEACHACSFVPETSCERGNRYLDRAVLVPTMSDRNVAFFRAVN